MPKDPFDHVTGMNQSNNYYDKSRGVGQPGAVESRINPAELSLALQRFRGGAPTSQEGNRYYYSGAQAPQENFQQPMSYNQPMQNPRQSRLSQFSRPLLGRR